MESLRGRVFGLHARKRLRPRLRPIDLQQDNNKIATVCYRLSAAPAVSMARGGRLDARTSDLTQCAGMIPYTHVSSGPVTIEVSIRQSQLLL
eukprot:scaffold2953_cov187-Ochromonas_danica.AAC.2